MNQILYEDTGDKPIRTKKIILFFSIAIIVFGVFFIGIGGYGLYNWLKKPEQLSTNKPVISVSMFEDNRIKLNVTHDKPIDKILYSWNDGEELTILGRDREVIEQLIEIPYGENILSLTVIDSIGIKETFTNTYIYSQGADVKKPTINLSVTNKLIHIKAQDETEISYITYRWNDEEETKIDIVDETSTIIEADVEIPKGENDLTVVAVDANNNTSTKIQKCKAYTRPVILMPRQRGEELTITVTDDLGLDYVEYTVNGQKYIWQSPTDDRKEWTHVHILDPGESNIVIKAFNKAGIEATTFYGRCEYTPR